MKIAVIVSQFNKDITRRLLDSALLRFQELNISKDNVQTVWVPGAIELPLIAQRFVKRGEVDAVICFGVVIRGVTDHYDYVCQQVSYGCQRLSLDFDTPVIFGVLTTQNKQQALARAGGEHSDKGREAVDAAIAMVHTLQALPLK